MKVEFYRHNLGEHEIASVVETLQGVFLTSGPRTRQFEREFAEYLGLAYGLGFTSWTSGAFLVLKAWEIGPGDEVLVPALTFVATANIVAHCGATPVFVDSDPLTGNMDLADLESKVTTRTRAIIPVHLYGHMIDMRGVRAIADRHGLKVLEDCAHCIEGMRDGLRPGSLGDAACFSFYATKNLACGEGGAVITNDLQLHERLQLLRLHGMSKSAADRYTARYQHWDMELLGYKANLTDIQAALLLPQLPRLDDLCAIKEGISRRYERAFDPAGITYPKVLPGVKSARHIFTIWAPEGARDEVMAELQSRGIGVAVNFRAIHLLKYYRETMGCKPGDLPVAESIGDRTITIPLYARLTDEEIDYVVSTVIEVCGKHS